MKYLNLIHNITEFLAKLGLIDDFNGNFKARVCYALSKKYLTKRSRPQYLIKGEVLFKIRKANVVNLFHVIVNFSLLFNSLEATHFKLKFLILIA